MYLPVGGPQLQTALSAMRSVPRGSVAASTISASSNRVDLPHALKIFLSPERIFHANSTQTNENHLPILWVESAQRIAR